MTMFSVRKCAGQIIRFFKLLFRKPVRQQLCRHHQAREDKWIEQHGTCMVRFRCPDCGLSFTVQRQLCWHHQTREDKWIEQDGTCMARFRCLDCDLSFTFHVIADPATWLEES